MRNILSGKINQMRKIAIIKLISLTLFLVATYFLPAIVGAQEFSADVVTNASGQPMQGKMFTNQKKSRIEIAGTITIGRIDKGVAWVLMPAQKAYMEVPLERSSMIVSSGKLPSEIERKFLGKEIIDGKEVEKYQITYETNGKKDAIFSWIIPRTGIPVKTRAADGSWQVEYKNIKIGPQPESIFEIPVGYQRMSMPSLKDMMRNVMTEQLD